ncbi:hypothetical protein C8F01DRAFT_1140663 [Mycena amicta]|nr:hypothetical protein C8F01DRAFT_1140663 [Mycena amicta]
MTTTLAPLPTDTYDDERRHYLVERNVTLPPTATSGVPASNAITQSHSHRPTPTKHFQSDKQRNTPVGLIWGVSIAVVVAIVALFLVRFLFIRRARKRAVAAGVGVVQGKRASMAKGKGSLESGASVKMEYPLPPRPPPAHGYPHQHHHQPDVEQQLPATERDAVELREYDYPPMPAPPSSSSPSPPTLSPSPYTQNQPSGWSAPFSSQAASSTPFVQGYAQPAPGPGSLPEERQAYLSAEIRSVQTQLERNGNGNGEERERKALRARIHELEDRQQSAWALGLE